MLNTVYYSELSRDIAMRIGEQHSSENVMLRDFEKLAEDARLGMPLVRERLTVSDRAHQERSTAGARHRSRCGKSGRCDPPTV